MARASRRLLVLIVLALVLAQPGLPGANAHGEQPAGHHEESTSQTQADPPGGQVDPDAHPLTPNARYVEQTDPDVHGDLVVWSQRQLGRDWDIMAYNLSGDGLGYPITLEEVDERNPAVRGPWIAWEEHNKASIDIVVLNQRSGSLVRIPDTGGDERYPTFAGDIVFYHVRTGPDGGLLRGYDLVRERIVDPIGNRTILHPPSASGQHVAWADGAKLDSKVHVTNVYTGETRDIPNTWRLEEPPELGSFGTAFVAGFGGAQHGTYTVLYNETRGFQYYRTGIYPHRNLAVCDIGVMWDQPGAPSVDEHAIALWDRYIERTLTFGNGNHDPDCAGDHLVYEKEHAPEDPDLDPTTRIYHLDLASARIPAEATIRLEPGMERGIYRGQVTFEGYAEPGDPREPIARVLGTVDGGEFRQLRTEPHGDGVKWQMRIDARNYFSGEHALSIVVEDTFGHRSRTGFTFFTDSPYSPSQSLYDRALEIPREASQPFPFNILDHYDRYRPFYNTILLVLVVVGGLSWWGYRYWKNRPPATPEYVAPGEDASEDPGPGVQAGSKGARKDPW